MPSTTTDRIDGLTTSVAVKAPCRVATTANIGLSGLQTINGVALANGDRVLVKDQTDTTENGIYVAAAGAWLRARDFDGSRDAVPGTLVIVQNSGNDIIYKTVAASSPIVFDSSSITFQLAAFSDSSSLSFLQSGTGAVARSVQSRLRDSINVFDFFSASQIADVQAGTAALDVASAIQAAMDSLPTNGGKIYFPQGIYKCTAALNPGTKQMIFEGSGWSTLVAAAFGDAQWLAAGAIKGTVLKFTAAAASGILLNGTQHRGFVIRDMALLGPGSGTTVGLNCDGGVTATLQNRCYNIFIANFYRGVRFAASYDNTWYDLHVWGCTDGLFYDPAGGGVTDQYFFRVDIEVCGTAINGQNGTQQCFYGGLIQANTMGINLNPGASGISRWTIDGIWFEQNTTALKFDATAGIVQQIIVRGNRFSSTPDAWTFAGGFTLTGFFFYGNDAPGVSVTLPANMVDSMMIGGRLTALTDNSVNTTCFNVIASATRVQKVYYGDGIVDTYGAGSPEGVLTARIGSTYRRTNGGAGTSLYVKESGVGNVGWIGK